MIVRCNYEELQALNAGAQAVLSRSEEDGGGVAAPSELLDRVARLLPRLDGDLAVATLVEQRELQATLEGVVAALRVEMETLVVAHHPADEFAVGAYFDFAHALVVLNRVRELGEEMEAILNVVTGQDEATEAAQSFVFPD